MKLHFTSALTQHSRHKHLVFSISWQINHESNTTDIIPVPLSVCVCAFLMAGKYQPEPFLYANAYLCNTDFKRSTCDESGQQVPECVAALAAGTSHPDCQGERAGAARMASHPVKPWFALAQLFMHFMPQPHTRHAVNHREDIRSV